MEQADFFDVRVASKSALTPDIVQFELVHPDGAPLPPFTAGAHIEVTLPGGLQRSYSLCNPPSERHRYVLGVLRDANSRGGSQAMHAQVAAGDCVRISAPRNHFPLTEGAQRSILLAGGIGITPLLSMAWQLSSQGAAFELHYCARSAAHAGFASTLAAAPFSAQVHTHLDDGASSQKLDLPALLGQVEAGTHVYVCGPEGFINAVLATAGQAGWPETQLHKELFSAEVVHEASDGAFEVEIAGSGQVVQVGPQETVTQALATAGIDIPVSCEQGICGTCLTRVVSGTPLHRDQYLTDEEQAANDQFTPCCSRARTARLVIDLTPI
jgi:vanillate O-demethylase ferredoxin subunit